MVAQYVHAERDDERVIRTYVHVDKDPVSAYDSETDNSVVYSPRDAPYVVIETLFMAIRYGFTEKGQQVELLANTRDCTKRIVDMIEFGQLCAHGVVMFKGMSVNQRTGLVKLCEHPFKTKGR